ncbi:N-acetylmuramoyl-L-alanine amidase family protein [Bacillus fungorum]|uniref:MurNAc-LAA domain-containing protein n=1 Tax=Bacillus fungorum TaxID=2039284 RepID=A0A2G6Q8T2_9BACI|nr:hypothetical protein CO726_22200 [Bacillus fungorum]
MKFNKLVLSYGVISALTLGVLGNNTYAKEVHKMNDTIHVVKHIPADILLTQTMDYSGEALQTRDRGVKHGDFHVIRENDMPAVLTELAFIDNGIDYSKLSTENGRQIAAEAIYEGILDYYEWKVNNVSEYRFQ